MSTSLPSDPASVVQRQLDAYNHRDAAGLAAIYADDAQQFEHPSKLLASGAAQIRDRFTERFKDPSVCAILKQRIVMGNLVVDHEEVTKSFSDGPGKIELLAIYEVTQGRISRAWFSFGPRLLR